MATFNSPRRIAARWKLVVILIFLSSRTFASDAPDKAFAPRAIAEFQRAQATYQTNANDATAAWQFARATYDLADFATNETQRADLANQGIAACRHAITQKLKLAAPHYYLAMNLGQLARTESVGALKLVKEMEYEFKLANGLDEHFDYAGPARNLGLLYHQAPGWPVSIGDRRDARSWLEHALSLASDYPENILNLAEAQLEWKQRAEAAEQLKKLDTLWPDAQKKFTGDAWAQSWDDWTKRREKLRATLNINPPVVTSPKYSH